MVSVTLIGAASRIIVTKLSRTQRIAARGLSMLMATAVVIGLGSCGATSRTSGEGTVRGSLVAVGGLAGTTPRPLRGTVTFDGAGGRSYVTNAGPGGRFSVRVPAGSYSATARSPQYQGGLVACRAEGRVTVRDQAPRYVTVGCQER
jgi:hypothetical protein